MRDPFPFKAIPVATQIKDFLTESLNLPTLPAHLHEVFFFVIFYHVVCTYISPFLSARIFPRVYPSLPRRTKLNWDVHVVSLVQSVYICSLAIWVINYDDERDAMKNDYRDRIWGYTGALGLVEASATGYFAWDLIMTSANIRIFGWGTLAHAIAASFAYGMGYVSLSSAFSIQERGLYTNHMSIASFRELLRPNLHSRGDILPFPQFPLVFRQARHDGLHTPIHQRHCPHDNIFRQSPRLGNLLFLQSIRRHKPCVPVSRYRCW